MRLDYNEKKMGREVERKPVPKNRPRKEPVGMFALLSVLALVLTYGAGVATGWFFFKGTGVAPAPAVAQPVKQVEPAPPPHPAGQPGQPAPDTPLTFYQTLPAGGKAVMGSGMNLKLPEVAPAAHRSVPAAAQTPAQPEPAKQEGQEKPEKKDKAEAAEKQEKAEKPEKQEKQEKQEQAAATRYLVQIASYRDKKEADEAQAKLSARGVAAYVVEARQADKSAWYRLRVGRHLTRAEAEQLALKAGKGAAVVAE